MIIEITGRSYSGRTSSVVKLLDKSKYTVVHSLDGDFAAVYERVTGNEIIDDFEERISISVGQLVEFNSNNWLGKIKDEFIQDFINGNDEVLVLDIPLPTAYVESLKRQLTSEMNNHKTLIIVNHQPIRAAGI